MEQKVVSLLLVLGTINIHFMDHHIVYIALAICPYAGGVRGLVGQSEEHS